MEKYKQANYIHKPYLYTIFMGFFLSTITGSIYGLIAEGTSNLLFLPFYIAFAACTTFFAYKACSAIYNNTKRRSKALKKEVTYNTSEEQLIDLGDHSEKGNEQEHNPYKTDGGILIPEVVQEVKQDEKPNLTFKNEMLLKSPKSSNISNEHADQYLKSPSQTQGTSFGIINHSVSKTTNQPPSSTFISKTNIPDKSTILPQPQSQNTNNQSKSVIPIPLPMPTAINDVPKISSQPQDITNSSKFTIPIAKSQDQLPPSPPPMSKGNLFGAKLQRINGRDELLYSIRSFDSKS